MSGKIAISTEYIKNASWIDLQHRMQLVCQKEVFLPLGLHQQAFGENTAPCKKSHVREDSRGNKQIAFSWNGKKPHIMTHVLSYVVHNKTRIEPGKDLQVSHVCGNHWCHEPTHLILESSQENQSRKNCIGKVWSAKHEEWIEVCEHIPPCLTARKPSLK